MGTFLVNGSLWPRLDPSATSAEANGCQQTHPTSTL